MDLVRYLKEKEIYKATIKEFCRIEKERSVLDMLSREFLPMFSDVRGEMTVDILKERFQRIRDI